MGNFTQAHEQRSLMQAQSNHLAMWQGLTSLEILLWLGTSEKDKDVDTLEKRYENN